MVSLGHLSAIYRPAPRKGRACMAEPIGVYSSLTSRMATDGDLPALRDLMALAIDDLQRGFLSPAEIVARRPVMGLDTQLVADRTYFVVEEADRLAGCGGWGRPAPPHG